MGRHYLKDALSNRLLFIKRQNETVGVSNRIESSFIKRQNETAGTPHRTDCYLSFMRHLHPSARPKNVDQLIKHNKKYPAQSAKMVITLVGKKLLFGFLVWGKSRCTFWKFSFPDKEANDAPTSPLPPLQRKI